MYLHDSSKRGLKDYVYPAMHGAYGFVYEDDGGSSTGTTSGCELVVKKNNGNGEKTLVYTLMTDINNLYMNKFHVNIATEAKPYEASIYCFNKLRTSRELDGPRQNEPPLTFKMYGIPFDGGDGDDDDAPTNSPTSTLTTATPTSPPTTACSVHGKRKNCNKDKPNRCKWKKRSQVKCVSKPCEDVKKQRQCKKGGCKWIKNEKKCVEQ